MGIKNFHSYLRKKIPNVYETIPVPELKNKTLSIDTSIFMCKFKNTYGNRWLNGFYQFILYLKKHDIHFIFILDSKPPPEKANEREIRSMNREKNRERIDILLEQWTHFLERNPVVQDITLDMILPHYDELGKFLQKKKLEPVFSPTVVSQHLGKLQKNIIRITGEDFELLKKMFQLMNITYYYADSEAEGTCSLLNRKNVVDGVLTEDTDVIAYGTPVMYFNFSFRDQTVQKLELSNILSELEISFEQLRDFCILCGTDYNSNLEKIGPTRSMDLIRKHHSFETISKVVDTTPINFIRIRHLFNCDQYEVKIDKINKNTEIIIRSEQLQEFCFYNNISIIKDTGDLYFSSTNFF